MSFMFNPNAYDEPTAINRPVLKTETVDALIVGITNVAEKLTNEIGVNGGVFTFDGYPSAEFTEIINLLNGKLTLKGADVLTIDISNFFYFYCAKILCKNQLIAPIIPFLLVLFYIIF